VVEQVNPDVVIHLAAQSLVQNSYLDPILTFETNVNGTLNLLNATKDLEKIQAQLIITTDKVYKNLGQSLGYVETDELGGRDPYSASKAMADIGTQSWISSFGITNTSIVRAGNVIGGGDNCANRLIPDLIKSYSTRETPKLRYPNSIRPWQHVLDCLNGYLILVDAMLTSKKSGVYNFGPGRNQLNTVENIANLVSHYWGGIEIPWSIDPTHHPYEAPVLVLDSTKARSELGWEEKLTFSEGIEWTVNWYKNFSLGQDALELTLADISNFDIKSSSH
jgi:CDP-glucose 4,6-dehydratase